MGDMLQNLEDVYKKWESKPRGPPRFSHREYDIDENQCEAFARRQSHANNRDNQRGAPQPFIRQRRLFPNRAIVQLPKFHGIAQFKMLPTITASPRTRPFTGLCCSKCLSLSRIAVPNPYISSLCVCNLLLLPYAGRDSFIPTFMLPTYFMLSRITNFSYPDVTQKVLQCDRLNSSITEAADVTTNGHGGQNVENFINKEKIRAQHILQSIESSISPFLLRLFCSLTYKMFSQIFKSVQVHNGHIELLTASSKEDVPIVYVPMHRSHMDYVLISFILYLRNLKVPLIALGDSLFVPFLSVIMKSLGALCIRRKNVDSSGSVDKLYDSVLQSYITECLKSNYSLEVFIEGGRSLSGKAQSPKLRLLSMIIDSILKGNIEDVLISTVSLSYEKIPEQNFVSEQLGKKRMPLSFFSTMLSIWRTLHTYLGSVRVDFGQPFSLKEFLKSCNAIPSPDNVVGVETPPSSPCSVSSCSGSMYGSGIIPSDVESVADNLAWHVMFDGTCNAALMSTHLVAFLFISKHRKGATESQFLCSFNWLRDELCKKKRDIGFSGDSTNVIKHALALLGKDLITTETIEMEWTSSDMQNNNVKILYLRPTVRIPYVFELQYYSNNVLPVFLLRSIVVNAVYALLDGEICHFQRCESKLQVSRQDLVSKALELCDLLRFEFLFIPPCEEINTAISCAIDELVEKEFIRVSVCDDQYLRGGIVNTGTRRNYSHYTFDDDEESACTPSQQFLKVDLGEETIENLEFFRTMLSPFIESYWLASCTLFSLISEIKEEKEFLREMQITAEDRLHKGLLRFEESFAMDTLKNTLRLFEFWQVIEHYYENNVKIMYLTENYDCEEKISHVISRIEEFRN